MSITAIIDDLAVKQWSLCQDILAPQHILHLCNEILSAYEADELNRAKVGQAELNIEKIRGDLIRWIDPA